MVSGIGTRNINKKRSIRHRFLRPCNFSYRDHKNMGCDGGCYGICKFDGVLWCFGDRGRWEVQHQPTFKMLVPEGNSRCAIVRGVKVHVDGMHCTGNGGVQWQAQTCMSPLWMRLLFLVQLVWGWHKRDKCTIFHSRLSKACMLSYQAHSAGDLDADTWRHDPLRLSQADSIKLSYVARLNSLPKAKIIPCCFAQTWALQADPLDGEACAKGVPGTGGVGAGGAWR